MESIWKQSFTHIIISVRFLGLNWEFWSESRVFGDDDSEFIEFVKTKYKRKFGTRSFTIRPVYPSTYYKVQ
jgi:hypothetical protein